MLPVGFGPSSLVVLEDKFIVLGPRLGLEGQVLGSVLGFEGRVLGPVLGLEGLVFGPGLGLEV